MDHKILHFSEDSSGRQIFISMSKYYVPSTAKSWKAHRMHGGGGFVTIPKTHRNNDTIKILFLMFWKRMAFRRLKYTLQGRYK